ncbi:MAG: Gfo/Idh/MocA family protein [Steroidobacteraceae bacterium]
MRVRRDSDPDPARTELAQAPIRVALVGVGKIAREQHAPALAADATFELAAAVSRHAALGGVRTFTNLESLLDAKLAIDAVSLCTPPAGRHALARAALDAGLHVMLEKPPGATVSEVNDLAARAHAAGLTLFATWHSREAIGVEPARAWLAQRTVMAVRTTWKEDIRVWHPGQNWILEPGGFGVFDPGINALSILTRILPQRLTLRGATLHFPANRFAPISAELDLLHGDAAPAPAVFDFLEAGPQRWDIEVATDRGVLLLSEGGQRVHIDGVEQFAAANREYPRLYSRFAQLIANGISDVDVTPLQLVADAFMLARRVETAAFEF